MRNPNRKLIVMLWTVIAVLVIGAGIGVFMTMNKLDSLSQEKADLTSVNSSLRQQLREAKATPNPSETPSPSATPTPSVTPSPSATPAATPSPTKTPTPKP